MRDQDDRLLRMRDLAIGKVRLIVEDQRDDIGAGNVVGGDDRELVPGNAAGIEDLADDAAGRGAAHRRAMEHPGQCQIVHVASLAGHLGSPFFSRNGLADRGHSTILHW